VTQAWDVKFICFILALVPLFWAPSSIFDQRGYVWFARIGAFVFLILQQIILVDFAYSLNDMLYNYSQPLLLAASLFLFATALTGLILLFVYFNGCETSNAFMSLALVFIVAFTGIQLCSDPEHGHNLLSSSAVACYVVYLTYVAVSSNPEGEGACNPLYSTSSNTLGMVLGLSIAFISMVATVYLASSSVTQLIAEANQEAKPPPSTNLTRDLLTGEADTTTAASAASMETVARRSFNGNSSGTVWKFNLVMVLICQYWCMVLTDWGDSTKTGSSSSPSAGYTVMWMNVAASWICIALYIWTLIAPWLFPDRDFS